MSLLPDLSALAIRPFLSNLLDRAQTLVGDCAEESLKSGPVAVAGPLVKLLLSRFTDSSQKLPEAVSRAADRAWRSLEVALAGESLWTRLRDRGEDKAFRHQVRTFLDAQALELNGQDDAFRGRCLDQLRAARRAGLVPGAADPSAAAQRTAEFGRFGDPTQSREAEWQVAARMARQLRTAGYRDLAELVDLRPPGQAAPLLAVAVRFFFRREIEQDDALFQGFVYAQVDRVSESVRMGFEQLDAAFATLGPALLQQREGLEQILGLLSALREDVLDLKGEMTRQGAGQQALYQEVIRIGARLDGLHDRALRPADSLSIHGPAERDLVKQLVARYRALPEEQRQHLPALLDAVGRLEMAAGDFPAAGGDFRRLTQLVNDPEARAAAHYSAYLAALEARDWQAALAELREAMRLAPGRHALFPLDRYEAEQILGAGGFGVVFLCRHRHTGARLVVKTLRSEDLDRDLQQLFAEASVLEELEHRSVIRLRDCGYADATQTRPYLVMEYFDGLTLEEHVKRHGQLAESDARAVGLLMAEGLHAVHARNLLHRDVKPGNVLVRRTTDGWLVKLIDFGLAVPRRAVADTQSHADALAQTPCGSSIAGTGDYAAPEQLGKLPGVAVGRYSDVYGFGRTLCLALFGTPHPGPRHWRGLADERLGEVIGACTEAQPRDRPADFAVVLELLAGRKQPITRHSPVLAVAVPVDVVAKDVKTLKRHTGRKTAETQRSPVVAVAVPAAVVAPDVPTVARPPRKKRRSKGRAAFFCVLLSVTVFGGGVLLWKQWSRSRNVEPPLSLAEKVRQSVTFRSWKSRSNVVRPDGQFYNDYFLRIDAPAEILDQVKEVIYDFGEDHKQNWQRASWPAKPWLLTGKDRAKGFEMYYPGTGFCNWDAHVTVVLRNDDRVAMTCNMYKVWE